MKSIENLFNNAIEHWRLNRGIGTALIPRRLDDRIMILGILQNIYCNNPSTSCLIITENFTDRVSIIDFITHQNNENDEEFKSLLDNKTLKILTEGFLNKGKINDSFSLVILYRPTSINDDIFKYVTSAKFKLVIINNRLNHIDISKLYNNCPLLDDFKQEDIEQIRMSTPVEETLISIQIPEDSEQFKILKYYNKYIETSLNIFGNFETIDKCRKGDINTNLSAVDICYNIAYENGWNPNLDMSIEYNRQIDELYNPNHLSDRAKETYEIIRNRSNFLADYDSKLEEVIKIVEDNPTSKILIINKRAEFASKITEYINNFSENTICSSYHDKLENILAKDEQGNPIVYKSGVKKGQPKELGITAQKKLIENNFNNGSIRVISTNNSPDKNLAIKADIVIITSSQCGNIENYLYRLSHLDISSPLKVFTLYIKNSLEEKKANEKIETDTHKIVKLYEKDVLSTNNFDFIIVD